MLHGLFVGNSASWYFTCAPELVREFRVLLYDLRGHGKSTRAPTGYDTATMAADLLGLLDALAGYPRVALVGHSYGALVALTFSRLHPDRVAKLALVEAPSPGGLPDVNKLFSLDVERMLEALPRTTRALFKSPRRSTLRLVEGLRFLGMQSSLLADLKAEHEPRPEDLARAPDPLLVYGDQSSCLPFGEKLAQAVPRHRFKVLSGGHYIHLDATRELTQLLKEYLRG
jgi:pimeloyl-ACP methyl ester carboxylesterase